MNESSGFMGNFDGLALVILGQREGERCDRFSVVLRLRVLLEGQVTEKHLDHEDAHAPKVSPCVIDLVRDHFIRVIA